MHFLTIQLCWQLNMWKYASCRTWKVTFFYICFILMSWVSATNSFAIFYQMKNMLEEFLPQKHNRWIRETFVTSLFVIIILLQLHFFVDHTEMLTCLGGKTSLCFIKVWARFVWLDTCLTSCLSELELCFRDVKEGDQTRTETTYTYCKCNMSLTISLNMLFSHVYNLHFLHFPGD